MEDDTLNAGALSPHDSLEDKRYTVGSRMEVLAILRSLMSKKALVAAYLEAPEDFILTSILAVDGERDEVILDYGSKAELNAAMFSAERVICITAQDGVKVKFELERIERVLHEGYEAFCAPVPDSLQRVQRRDHYRVAVPVANPLKCLIPIRNARGQSTAEVIVMDVSGGGIGVMDHHHLVDLEPGNRYRGCRMELTGVGTVTFDLEVKTSFEVTMRNGLSCKRSGCEFIDLPPMTAGAIQRYIMQLERERNARLRR